MSWKSKTPGIQRWSVGFCLLPFHDFEAFQREDGARFVRFLENVWNVELKMKSSKKSDDMVVQRYEIVRTTTRREQRRGSYGTADSSNSRSLQSLTEKAATWTRNSNLNHLNNSAEHTHSHTQSTRGIGPSPKADVSVNQRVKQGSWHHTKRAPARKTFSFG